MDFNQSGLSLIEISHRSKAFVDVIEEAKDIALDLLDLNNKGYKVLFLQGGASTQFLMTAYNLLETKASFLNTGSWSDKAIKEAKLFGSVNELASSKDSNFNYIPKDYSIPSDSDYFHCTSNNTIFGTQIKDFKESSVPVICDMSSDIFSRVLDFSKFDLIFVMVIDSKPPILSLVSSCSKFYRNPKISRLLFTIPQKQTPVNGAFEETSRFPTLWDVAKSYCDSDY
jgi:phosphoserine aminotransferase